MSETRDNGPIPEQAAPREPQPPGPTPEQGVGEALSQARKALGLSLEDVAQQLKFGTRQIEALEQGRFDGLHGATFARGMVRSYARLVKLEPEPLLERIEGRVPRPAAPGAAISIRRPIPFSDTARGTNFVYVVLSIVVLAIGAAVAFEWHQDRGAKSTPLTFVPAAQAPLEPPRALASAAGPIPAPPGHASTPSAAPSAAAPSAPSSPDRVPSVPAGAPAEAATAVTASAAAPTVTAATESEPAAASQPAAEAHLGRLVLDFAEESWVEVKDASGKKLLSQLNPAGTEQVLEGAPPLSLVIGNAQHVTVTYDGKPVDLTPHIRVEVARLTLN
jgi:cytoskeleton protein RodZ